MTDLATLYKKYQKPLYFFAFSIIKNAEEAEDIATEAFMKLHVKYGQVDESAAKAILFELVKNACVDYLRSWWRKNHINELNEDRIEVRVTAEYVRAEVFEVLYNEIEDLPTGCRKVFKLAFYRQMGTRQIAAVLKIAENTVLNQKNKAIQLLRTVLLKKGLIN